MAVAAFKSSSRRGNQTSNTSSSYSGRQSREEAPNKAPIRRSRSVSAFSRSNLDVSTEFLNKRDNPLFWSTTSPRDGDDDESQSTKTVGIAKFDEITTNSDSQGAGYADSACAIGTRGRSVTRSGEASGKGSMMGRKETVRSLSRVDAGRRNRSASQCPVSRRHFYYSTSESEAESKDGKDLELVGSNRKGGLFISNNNKGVLDQVKHLRTWSSQHSSIDASDCSAAYLSGLQTQNCEDVVSTASSGYGSDEKTIKAVCEQMKSVQADLPEASDIYETVRSEVRRAISDIQNDLETVIQRSNATAIALTNMVDIPPDLVNPGAVELVLDIRREYAKKLEESQERAGKLRADLAVEEHRGQELERILKEVLPYPKTPNTQKSRTARKASIERRRMSKHLEEDAKAYFDECVSLSTFDSSDFSSQEDPQLNLVGPPTQSGSHVFLPQESGIRGQSMSINYDISQPPSSDRAVEPIQCQVSSITGSTGSGCKSYFSFAQKPSETSGLQQDFQQYVKKFEKNVSKFSAMRSNYYDLHEYSHQSSAESLLIDRVALKNRIESGSLLLCGGGNLFSSKSCGIGI